jgi:ribosomal RNA-processing protein RRP42 (EC 3.1.13.-)
LIRKLRSENLPISTLVATITMAIIGDIIIVDPTLEEEIISDSILTIAVDEKERVCGAQKKGEKGISRSTLEKAVDIAIDKSKWLISYMKNVLNNPQEYTKPLSEMGA